MSRKTKHKEIHSNKKLCEINNSPLTISNEVSRSFYDEIKETHRFSDEQVIALLSKECQTFLDLIYKFRIKEDEHSFALKVKSIELPNSERIVEEIKDGNKVGRLKSN